MVAPHYKNVLAQISSGNQGGSTNYTSRYLAEEMASTNSRFNYSGLSQKEYSGRVFEMPLPIKKDQEDEKAKRYIPNTLLEMRLDYSLN
jgi:hypothetical protein